MKLIQTIFLIFILCKARGENPTIVLSIFYNPNDCYYCRGVLSTLESIDKSVKKQLWCPTSEKGVVAELLKNYDFRTTVIDVMPLKENFFNCERHDCPLSIISSYCILFSDNVKKDSFQLKNLPNKVHSINARINSLYNDSSPILQIPLPDTLNFSDQSVLHVSETTINVTDNVLNKNVTLVFNTDNTSLVSVEVIDREDIDINAILSLNAFDTAFFNGTYNIRKKIQAHYPKIEGAFFNKENTYLWLSLLYPRYANASDNLVRKKKITIKDTIFEKQTFLYLIPKSNIREHEVRTIPTVLPEGYSLFKGLPFYLNKGKAYFSTMNRAIDPERNMLAEFAIDSTSLRFISIVANKAGTLKNDKKHKGYELYKSINNTFYFVSKYPYALNYKTGEDFLLTSEDSTLFPPGKFFINDIWMKNNEIYALVVIDGNVSVYSFDPETKAKKSVKALKIPAEIDTQRIRRYNDNYFIILNKKKMIFIPAAS